ncbi:hypothetical protein MIR68_005715 [Amoeboaphelidium protococcarum]|nr:hypothetical protein MIR68_005715 [Amoeboaphelidium protococcarum]
MLWLICAVCVMTLNVIDSARIFECDNVALSLLNGILPDIVSVKIADMAFLLLPDEIANFAAPAMSLLKQCTLHEDVKMRAYSSNNVTVQKDPPNWPLRAIDTRQQELTADYTFPESAGNGSYIYIVDSGITTNHVEFLSPNNCSESRASFGASFIADPSRDDVNGHGTIVAGMAIGNTVGVAKQAQAIGVQVLDQNGEANVSVILRGLEWAYDDAVSRNLSRGSAVINLSLGGFYSSALNRAVNRISDEGVPIVAAAGNEGISACLFSPASAGEAITVGSFNQDFRISTFSNTGRCVDIYAGGEDIYSSVFENAPISELSGIRKVSTQCSNDSTYIEQSGTSFSAPVVSGILAIYQSHFKINQTDAIDPDSYSSDLKELLIDQSTSQRLGRSQVQVAYVYPPQFQTPNVSNSQSSASPISLRKLLPVIIAISIVLMSVS